MATLYGQSVKSCLSHACSGKAFFWSKLQEISQRGPSSTAIASAGWIIGTARFRMLCPTWPCPRLSSSFVHTLFCARAQGHGSSALCKSFLALASAATKRYRRFGGVLVSACAGTDTVARHFATAVAQHFATAHAAQEDPAWCCYACRRAHLHSLACAGRVQSMFCVQVLPLTLHGIER